MTAAELRAISERLRGTHPNADSMRLYSALERLIDHCVIAVNDRWCITGMPGDLIWFATRDAAIDVLLGGGV